MGIMDMFKSGSQQQPQQQQQQQKPQMNNQQQQDQNNQQNGKMAGSQQEPTDPLAAYSKMWDNAAGAETTAPPSFTLDPKVLGEASSQIKFTEGINPELMQRATNGDMSAMVEMMNAVAQNTYRTALSHGSTLTDRFVGARSAYDSKQMTPHIKNQLLTQELQGIQGYSHPAVKKTLDTVAQQVQRQNPDASPAEVAKMTKEYFTAMMSVTGMSPGGSQQNGQGGAQMPQEMDWESWLGKDNG